MKYILIVSSFHKRSIINKKRRGKYYGLMSNKDLVAFRVLNER